MENLAENSEKDPRFTIAVLDDLPVTAQLIALILRTNLDCRVQAFTTASELLEQKPEKFPDLYLLDIMLENGSGIDVCRRLREDPARRKIPVIFLSAHGKPEVRVAALKAGGNDYLDKPFYPEELLVRVRAQLALHTAELVTNQQLKKYEEEVTSWRRTVLPLLSDLVAFFSRREGGAKAGTDVAEQLRERCQEALLCLQQGHGRGAEAGAGAWQPSRFSMAQLLREAALRVDAECTQKKVSIEVVCPADGTAYFDTELLRERLLVHLLRDAIRYSFPGKSILLKAQPLEKQGVPGWQIRVQDGSEEDRSVHFVQQMMARYQPLSQQPNQPAPGSAEWLAHMQALLREHGADLRVSSAPGQGRIVDVRIWEQPANGESQAS